GIGFVVTRPHGFTSLCPADRPDCGHAFAAVLDGGDSRLSPAAELRARIFLSMPCAVSLLQRIAIGSECADLLRRTADRTAPIHDPNHYNRIVLVPCVADAHAHGVGRAAKPAEEPPVEAGSGVVFLCGGTAPDHSQRPAAGRGRQLRLRAAGRLA